MKATNSNEIFNFIGIDCQLVTHTYQDNGALAVQVILLGLTKCGVAVATPERTQGCEARPFAPCRNHGVRGSARPKVAARFSLFRPVCRRRWRRESEERLDALCW